MYAQLLLAGTLAEALHMSPAVLVTGVRQSGKTTFSLHEGADRFGDVLDGLLA